MRAQSVDWDLSSSIPATNCPPSKPPFRVRRRQLLLSAAPDDNLFTSRSPVSPIPSVSAPFPVTAAVMSGLSPDDDDHAGAVASPAVRRQPTEPSTMNREIGLPATASPHARRERAAPRPWPKHDEAATAEPSRQDHADFYDIDVEIAPPDPNSTLRSSSSSKHGREIISDIPTFPDTPISPRWDSLSNRPAWVFASNPSSPSASQFHTTQPSQRTRAESTPTPRVAVRPAFTALSSNPFIPEAPEFDPPTSNTREFPLLGRPHDALGQTATPISPVANSDPAFEYRQTTTTPEGPMIVENFSRPRKPSMRSQRSDPSYSRQAPTSGVGLQLDSLSDQPPINQVSPYYNSLWPRSRGLSGSSSKSSSTYSSNPHRPSNDHLGVQSRTGSLRRPNPQSGVPPRPSLTYNNNGPQPSTREVPPWLAGGDELRSSFRSQLTTSTAQGTLFTAAGTERSSVLTKASSITEHSIINGYAGTNWRPDSVVDDGPSLEDVMGMYERGFNDSDIESIRRSMRFADEEDDVFDLDTEAGPAGPDNSRPPSSRSETSRVRDQMLEAMNDELPIRGALTVPESTRSTKRESVNNFRKSLLPSSLPKDMGLGLAAEHMARRKGSDTTTESGKHDSAKMLDGDGNQAAPQVAIRKAPLAASNGVINIPPRAATPSPNPQTVPEPPEDPDSRDRYGFRKASVNVTRQQFDAWDASYTEYLSRRRKKWIALLKENSLMTDQPNRFPPRSAKTKRFVRKGIPPDWRGAAWFYYAGGPAIMAKHRGVYDELVKRAALDPTGSGKIPGQTSEVKPLIIEDIEKDLYRTFPDNVRFRPQHPGQPANTSQGADAEPSEMASEPEMITSLRRVLNAFALYNPRIGYCQSLNFIAGMLLLFIETEEQSFWLLNVITRVYLPGTHEMSLEGSKVDLGVLMLALKDSLPGVWKQIGGDEIDGGSSKKSKGRRRKDGGIKSDPSANDPNRLPPITLCMTAWFMSCFIGTLPTETVLRVWDVFFYEGSRTLFRIALTIFKLAEPEIKAVADPMETFGVVQTFPRRLIDCNALMEACYKRRNGIGHLSQEAVEEKREERRAGIRKWKADQESTDNGSRSGTTATAGLDLATDMEALEVRRKGTLFGRKKDREQARAAEVM
ncbi:hypothetical protein B0T24DRAFT_141664 [Lasiosphaeria ovina]|uniref:Rab-GAP TBC domain-containing protein n=1 Tax=Lasiosphaeria ovina TaxID=92902 RepID=A0AAE0KME4_9PEZI|nr:hypothetical protein B0T24DRAFT_141664 [Lasiosphaeria ovina]